MGGVSLGVSGIVSLGVSPDVSSLGVSYVGTVSLGVSPDVSYIDVVSLGVSGVVVYFPIS